MSLPQKLNILFYKHRLSILFIFVTIIYFGIYLPQTYNKQLFIQDDEYILAPITSAKDFISIYKGEVIDAQPIRDLSYWIDFKLQPIFHFSTFKMTNLLIWYFCFLLIHFLLLAFKETYNLSVSGIACLIIAALVLLHPSMSIPIAWISSRKHLLAFFFILLATIFHLKFLKSGSKWYFAFSQFAYVFSLLSHVIYAPWCLWVLFTTYDFGLLRNFRSLAFPFICCLSGATISIGNYLFYKSLYLKLNLVNIKGINVEYTKETMYMPLLAFGRYFINFIDLGAANILYNIKTVPNYCGAFLFLLFLFLGIKNFKLPIFRSLFVLFLSVTLTFTFFILGTFVQNYYALYMTTIVFFSCYLMYSKSKYNTPAFKTLFSSLVVSIFILEIYSSNYMATLWKKNIDILRYYKDQDDIADTKFWYLSEKVFSQLRSERIPSADFFLETTQLFYELRTDIEIFASPGKVSNNMAFKTYYGYLNLLVNNPYINLKTKNDIIGKICHPMIIYCNFFGGFIEYHLNKKELALNSYVLFLQKLFRILEHESSKTMFFVNYSFRQQWKLYMDMIINLPEFHEKTLPEFKRIIDLVIERNMDLPLYNPKPLNNSSKPAGQQLILNFLKLDNKISNTSCVYTHKSLGK